VLIISDAPQLVHSEIGDNKPVRRECLWIVTIAIRDRKHLGAISDSLCLSRPRRYCGRSPDRATRPTIGLNSSRFARPSVREILSYEFVAERPQVMQDSDIESEKIGVDGLTNSSITR
jgi:hypothetical protein